VQIGCNTCTGTILNQRTEQGNLRFYLLTARHCTIGQNFDNPCVLHFNYQSPDGISNNTPRWNQGLVDEQTIPLTGIDSGYEYRHVSHLRLVGHFAWGDFSLLEILTPIPPHFNISYAGWNPSKFHNGIEIGLPNHPFDSYIGIHHPRQDIKKASSTDYIRWQNKTVAVDCYTVTVIIDVLFGWIWGRRFSTQVICNYMEIPYLEVTAWNHGTTEGGSSGSGLFNRNNKVIGQLTGGPLSACNPGIWDPYGKFQSNYFNYTVRTSLNPDYNLSADLFGIDGRKITCYNNLELPGAPGVSGHYFPANHYQPENTIVLQAANNITTTQPIRVYDGADYRFRAGGTIDIGPGFEVEQGANVVMEIQGCTANKEENIESQMIQNLRSVKVPKYKKLDVASISEGQLFNKDSNPELVMQVFPNPSTGTFKIRFSKEDNYQIQISNSVGSIVFADKLKNVGEKSFDLKLSTGLYFITVTDSKNNQIMGKISIQQ